jgi:hypothetical protein
LRQSYGLGRQQRSRAGQGRLVGGPAAQGRLGGLDVNQLIEDLGQALGALLEAEPSASAGRRRAACTSATSRTRRPDR